MNTKRFFLLTVGLLFCILGCTREPADDGMDEHDEDMDDDDNHDDKDEYQDDDHDD